jgi:hypothetical protein
MTPDPLRADRHRLWRGLAFAVLIEAAVVFVILLARAL